MNDKPSNLLGILQVLYKWRKTLRNLVLGALVISIVISLLLDTYYKSTTIFYPASPQLANPELLFGYTTNVTQYYGSDSDLDRLLEIAVSSELLDYLVDTFNLYTHYDVDSTSAKGPYKVREKLLERYDVQKNKYDAIEISVEDTDRELCQKMANAARDKIDFIAQRLTKSAQANLLIAFENNISKKKVDLNRYEDSLKYLRKTYNIIEPNEQGGHLGRLVSEAQSNILKISAKIESLEKNPDIPKDTIAYLRANLLAFEREYEGLKGNKPNDKGGFGTDNLNMRGFMDGASQIVVVQDLHYQGRKQLTYDMERYNQLLSAYNTKIPALHIIEKAEYPLIKSRPKRSILVLSSVVAALLFGILGVLFAESYRHINWAAIKQNEA